MKTWMKVALVLVAVGALVAWMVVSENDRRARMTAETVAILTSVTLDEDEESSSLDETDLEYSYEAEGQARTGSDSIPGDVTAQLSPGQQVRLCYNPQDPSESDVRLNDAPCG